MINIFLVLYLLLSHWIADFIFQDEKWALSKKSSFKSLLKHTITYSLVMGYLFMFVFNLFNLILFIIFAFMSHTAVDYFTSKWVGKMFSQNKLGSSIPNFGAFSIIGLDQLIHYIVLIFTLYILY